MERLRGSRDSTIVVWGRGVTHILDRAVLSKSFETQSTQSSNTQLKGILNFSFHRDGLLLTNILLHKVLHDKVQLQGT